MSHWVCLNCKNKNQENMKFCPICHQSRLLSERQAAELRQEAAARAQTAAAERPARSKGKTLRIILIAANAVCLVLNIAGIVILLK